MWDATQDGAPAHTVAGESGWSEAVEAAYRDDFSRLLATLSLVCGKREVAEDIVQEAFMRSAERLEAIEPTARRAYVRAAALNLWRNRLRRRAIEIRHLGARQIEDPEIPDIEERDSLWRAVRGLPTRRRACIVLRYYESLSDSEIAALLNCSEGTVRSQVSRALVTLREALSHDS